MEPAPVARGEAVPVDAGEAAPDDAGEGPLAGDAAALGGAGGPGGALGGSLAAACVAAVGGCAVVATSARAAAGAPTSATVITIESAPAAAERRSRRTSGCPVGIGEHELESTIAARDRLGDGDGRLGATGGGRLAEGLHERRAHALQTGIDDTPAIQQRRRHAEVLHDDCVFDDGDAWEARARERLVRARERAQRVVAVARHGELERASGAGEGLRDDGK